MATRQTWAHEVAKKVEAVGWRVTTMTGGAYKVWMPACNDARCNHLMQLHLTASDINAHKSVLRELKAHGFDDAEARRARRRANDKAQRIKADRLTAEAAINEAEAAMTDVQFLTPTPNSVPTTATGKTRKPAKSALARAAGPYLTEPENVGIMWFADKHPAPWMRWVWITPEIADFLLENHNSKNRPKNDRQVMHYVRIIQSGQWRLTHQGIAMDTEAVLQDGQHRLQAVVAAAAEMGDPDLKVAFMFTVGMPVENFKAIDEGLLRTAAQLFGRGGEKNGSTLQTTIRLAISYKDQDGLYGFRIKLPNQQVIDEFANDPDEYREAASHAQSNYKKYHSSPGAIAAARYLIRRANGPDNRYVGAFFEGLMTGRKAGTRTVLEDADPRNVYRELMINNRLKGARITSRDQMAMIIMSWNNLVNNYTPRYLKYNDDTPVPRILICKDEGSDASACPALLVGEVDGDEDGD